MIGVGVQSQGCGSRVQSLGAQQLRQEPSCVDLKLLRALSLGFGILGLGFGNCGPTGYYQSCAR